MVNKHLWAQSFVVVSGEILAFVEDGQLQRHLPRMFFNDQERKLGDRKQSNTIILSNVNHADQRWEEGERV